MSDKIKIASSVLLMFASFAIVGLVVFLAVSMRRHGLWTALGFVTAIFLGKWGFSAFKHNYNAFIMKKFR